MKRFISLLLVMSTLIFMACDGDVTINLYVQDLLDLKASKIPKSYTTASVIVSNITKDSEKEFLRSVIGNITNERMVSHGYSEAYSFDTKIPILGKGVPISEVADNDLLFLQMSQTPDGYLLAYQYNPIVLNRIRSWIKSEYYQEFTTKDFTVNIKLDNDSRDDFAFTIRSAYINDKAYPFEVSNSLKRRETLDIKLSEVLKMAVETSSDYIPFIMFK